MMRTVRRVGFFLGAVILALAAGYAADAWPYVFEPNPPNPGAERFPLKVAVLAFRDGTEDFAMRGSNTFPEGLTYNMAKSGMPAELWAKMLADDLSASEAFLSVRFLHNASELRDEDFRIEGTLEKAYVPGVPSERPIEYAFSLRAFRGAEKEPFWTKEVARSFLVPKNHYAGCGTNVQCLTERSNEDFNRRMRGMFLEAREDLEKRLATEKGAGRPAEAGESLEQTIDKILKGK